MKILTTFIIGLICLSSCTNKQKITLLQFNIWQEGTIIEGGYQAIVNEIDRTDADFIMLSEVRNYNNTRFCDRIVASLKEKGKNYYSFYSYDSGLLSKYPITDSVSVFPENEDHGSIYKLVTDINGQRVAVYTAHLDYLDCTYYEVRGYDGNTWRELDAPLTDLDKIIERNKKSQRDDAIKKFIADAKVEKLNGSLIFLGGDFNEPSHLDWVESTKDMRDHQGLVIPWTVTTLLEQNGYKDAYRTYFPDPVEYPGFTYPSDNKDISVDKLSWAPKADERERIDYIFYYPHHKLTLKSAAILGPKSSIYRNQRTPDKRLDAFVEPLDIWPSDHKGVIAEFEF